MARRLTRSQFATKQGYANYKRFMKKNRKPRIKMGKMFTTKRGKYGCYKYVNGRRVAFVTKRRRK